MKKLVSLVLCLAVVAPPGSAQVRSVPVVPEGAPLPALTVPELNVQPIEAVGPQLSQLSALEGLRPLEGVRSQLSQLSREARGFAHAQAKPSSAADAASVSATELFRKALGLGRGAVRRELSGIDAGAPAPLLSAPERASKPSKAPLHEKGVYSNNRLKVFEWDPESFALEYLLDVEGGTPKPYEFLVGGVVHETMEAVYSMVQKGRDGASITLEEVLGIYDEAWEKGLKEGSFESNTDFTKDEYRRRGQKWVARKYQQLHPFKLQGRIFSLEKEFRFELKDPSTGKSYPFTGTPDRVRVDGDTVYIEDWKTHMNPPSLEQLKREDYQLGLYAIGLKQLYPDLFAGKRVVLAWHYREFSHQIAADDAYLVEVRERLLRVLHGIESFTRRFDGERKEWERRARPKAKAPGLPQARRQVGALGALEDKIRAKRLELRHLEAAIREKEEGLKAYADAKGLDEIAGKSYRAVFQRSSEKAVPTLQSDAKAHAEMVRVLKEGGVWDRYSQLDYTALKAAAELAGHPDHAAFEPILPRLSMTHSNRLSVRGKAEAGSLSNGVREYRLHPESEDTAAREPGVYSASRVALFEKSPKDYALQYLFGVKDTGAKSYELLVGLAAHETMEAVFQSLKGGRLAKDIAFAQVIKLYREIWHERAAEGNYKAAKGWLPSDYRKKGEEYLRAKWDQLYPFDQGEILWLERRMHFDITDPKTGKTYRFQGIPDRVMIEGDTVVIRDWKTHFVPLTEDEIRADDFQLALYAIGMRQLFPGLMAGKKIRLMWDFKDKPVVIEADEAYLEAARERVVGLLRDLEKFTEEVNKDRERWERVAGKLKLPKNASDARRWVDGLAKLGADRDARKAELDALVEKQKPLRDAVAAFARESGWWRIEGARYVASLQKTPAVDVPTKSSDAEANAEIIKALKAAGLWEKYSQVNYYALKPALKKALGDPKHPDHAVLKKLEPLLQAGAGTKMELEPAPAEKTPPQAPAPPTDEAKKKS